MESMRGVMRIARFSTGYCSLLRRRSEGTDCKSTRPSMIASPILLTLVRIKPPHISTNEAVSGVFPLFYVGSYGGNTCHGGFLEEGG